MDESDVQKLLDIYEKYSSGSDEQELQEFGSKLTKEDIESLIQISIAKNLSPDIVLNAIFESINDSALTKKVILIAMKQIQKWNFASTDKARQFTLALCKMIPQVASNKTAILIIDKAFTNSLKIKDDERRPYVVESLLSLIPLVFQKYYDKQDNVKIKSVEKTCQQHCQEWINNVLEQDIPEFVAPALVDTFTELPLSEEQADLLVSKTIQTTGFNNISIIARRLFPAIRKYPKVTYQCLKKLITSALEVEKLDYQGEDIEKVRSQCSLIKTLFTVSNTSRTVLDGLIKILTSPTELPTHFTPFLISLTFDVSRLNSKIKDSTQKFFNEQIKNDSLRIRSRFLNHIYYTESSFDNIKSLEYAMTYAINLSHINLETNAHNFIEFAFNLIDNSKDNTGFHKSPATSKFKLVESSSQFISENVRQIELGVKILEKCLEDFSSSKSEIFGQIVQRLISNSQNSVYLVQLLDSPEHLLEVIDYLQYLELPVVEQLMRYAVPKICGNESYLDRAIMDARKAFFNRTEKAKLNGVAALFYLILPRHERTFTQAMSNNEYEMMFSNSSFLDAAASEDAQHDIFNLMRRGFTQSDQVQADIYFFIPFLLMKCPDLSTVIYESFTEKLESISHIGTPHSVKDEDGITLTTVKAEKDGDTGKLTGIDGVYEGFPLTINTSVPHFIHCLSRCLRVLPDNVKQTPEWTSISDTLNSLCDEMSKVDFDFLFNSMDIFQHPDLRECIISIVSVLFNHSFLIDKDVSLALFRLYDRIIHKKAEIGKMRKDELKSELKFPRFMELPVLKELFKLLEEENGDYSDNYGIQLYALENSKDMISELSGLRLEMRGERMKRVMTLGQILYDSYEKVKWAEPPAGFKTNLSLPDILTTSLKQLFTFVFETYKEEYVKKFMQKMALITPTEQIADSCSLILKKIKWNISHQYTKSVENFCCIAENVALISTKNELNFKTIKKMLEKLIRANSPLAGRILKLARYYCSFNLEWLKEFAYMISEKVGDNDADGNEGSATYSSALLEMIATLGVYLSDIDWAVKVWLPQVNAEDSDKSAYFAEKFSAFLIQMTEITEILIQIDFKRFPPNYYESFVKFVNEFYKMLNRLLKQTLEVPTSTNAELDHLVRKITSEFDEKVIDFTINNQVNQKGKHKGMTRQDKFDATYAPQLHFYIDKLRTFVKTLVEKKLLDDDILEGFCKLKGTDVKISSAGRSKKKKKKLEEIEDEVPMQQDEMENPNIEEQQEVYDANPDNYNENEGEGENYEENYGEGEDENENELEKEYGSYMIHNEDEDM